MQKVLLVDDDALVRMFLRQILPWEREGYCIVGDARDGEEALQMVAQFSPDIIISDVSMPMLDGVQLVQQVRSKGFAGSIIMLSCHDDFEYVKNAMQLGADEYLLKNHLNADSLRSALRTVAQKRAAAPDAHADMERFAEKGQRAMQRELLERLLRESVAEPKPLLRQAGFAATYATCAVVLARIARSAQERAASFFDLCLQLEASGEMTGVTVVQLGRLRCAFLVDFSREPSSAKQTEQLRMLCSKLDSAMSEYLQIKVLIGVSESCMGADAISRALRQAEQALISSFYGAAVCWFGTPQAQLCSELPEQAVAFSACLPSLLRGSAAELEAQYHSALLAIAQTATHPGTVLHWLQRCDGQAGVSRTMKQYASLETFADYGACVTAYKELLSDTAQKVPDALSTPIARAVHYMRAHFTEQLTLRDVAEKAGFHPSYFSTVFKQELGMGFSVYLTELRIARICRMLTEQGGTIKELSRQVGFFDYQHFCKTFKKKVGVSPADFRKNNPKISQHF